MDFSAKKDFQSWKKCIDISEYQSKMFIHNLDVDAVYVRYIHGIIIDSFYKSAFGIFKNNNIKTGIYCIVYPALGLFNAIESIQRSYDESLKHDFMLSLDLEFINNSYGFEESSFFMRLIDWLSKNYNQPFLWYTNKSFIESLDLNKDCLDYLAKQPLWVANYTSSNKPLLPKTHSNFDMWQFAGSAKGFEGKLKGQNVLIDLNYMSEDFYNQYRTFKS